MQTVHVTEIIVAPNRQRREFSQSSINELASSIDRLGLLHPIVVRYTEDGIFLVAGERRLRACQELLLKDKNIRVGFSICDPDYIPITAINSLSPLEAFEAELEENILRVDLTWQERADATSKLLHLRSEQGSPTTSRALATEILGAPASGSQISAVSDDIILAQHLSDPEVAKAPSKKEALKVIKKKLEREHRAVLAQTFDLTSTKHTLTLGDSLEELKLLPDGTFDVLLTDPPYGIGADTFGGQASAGHAYADSKEYFETLIDTLAVESFRVCKAESHAYIFCDIRYFHTVELAFSLAGWDVWATPLIWAKSNGMLPRPEHGPRRTYEAIVYAIKGNRRVNAVYPDVINVSNDSRIDHGAQKPVDLYINLLQRSVRPGDSVLDPFAGSGTIFPAADRVKCVARGIEINPDYYNLALTRMHGKGTEIEGLDELDIEGL